MTLYFIRRKRFFSGTVTANQKTSAKLLKDAGNDYELVEMHLQSIENTEIEDATLIGGMGSCRTKPEGVKKDVYLGFTPIYDYNSEAKNWLQCLDKQDFEKLKTKPFETHNLQEYFFGTSLYVKIKTK